MNKNIFIAQTAIFVAAAAVLGFIESLLPVPSGLYGMKLGLSNIVVLVVLYLLGTKNAVWAAFTKILVCSLLYSGVSGLLYSICGGVLSLAIEIFLKRTRLFSIIGVSCAGGIFHNLGQLLCACILIGKNVFYYFPVLVLSGTVTGILTGIAAAAVVKKGEAFLEQK